MKRHVAFCAAFVAYLISTWAVLDAGPVQIVEQSRSLSVTAIQDPLSSPDPNAQTVTVSDARQASDFAPFDVTLHADADPGQPGYHLTASHTSTLSDSGFAVRGTYSVNTFISDGIGEVVSKLGVGFILDEPRHYDLHYLMTLQMTGNPGDDADFTVALKRLGSNPATLIEQQVPLVPFAEGSRKFDASGELEPGQYRLDMLFDEKLNDIVTTNRYLGTFDFRSAASPIPLPGAAKATAALLACIVCGQQLRRRLRPAA